MTNPIHTEAIHHLTLTETDLGGAIEFYTSMLGFQKSNGSESNRRLLANGKTIQALTEAPDPSRAIPEDCFNENRAGLDHLSFNVDNRRHLVKAVRNFSE